jgi:hypothetical protein
MRKKKTTSERFSTAGTVIGVLVFLGWLLYTLVQFESMKLDGWRFMLPALIMLLLVLVARQKATLGGALLCGVGLLIGGRYLDVRGDLMEQVVVFVRTGGPYLLVGVLFLVAGILEKKKNG